MTDNSRLDKALRGFKKTIERYERQKDIYVDGEKIIISKDRIGVLMTVLLLSILVFLPICVLIYFIFTNTESIVLLLSSILIVICVPFKAYKTIKASNILTINIKSRYIKTEKPNKLLKIFFQTQQIAFSDIMLVDIIEKRMRVDIYASWKSLSITDINKKKIILNEFNGSFPEGFIASKLKFVIEVIIWTEKQNRI